MKFARLTLLMFFSLAVSFVAQAGGKEKPLTKQEKAWFDKKNWLQGISAQPNPSIDIAAFARHYKAHPERWQLAFKFIKEHDLATLPLGKQVLSEDVTVNVQEYTTREPGNEWLEGHRKYIDLQYMVTGKELHGSAKLSEGTVVNPYNEGKDVGHCTVPVITYYVATPTRFSIYFPNDIHITNLQYGEKAAVRKVVFKIKVD